MKKEWKSKRYKLLLETSTQRDTSSFFLETLYSGLFSLGQQKIWQNLHYMWHQKQLNLYQVLIGLLHMQDGQGCLLRILCTCQRWIVFVTNFPLFPCYKYGIYVHPTWTMVNSSFNKIRICILACVTMNCIFIPSCWLVVLITPPEYVPYVSSLGCKMSI